MNILQLQERLKDLPDNALMQEMQMPTGTAPQFLVLSELKRRKRMRDDYQRQQNADVPTVAEETITAAGMPQGGIMDAARAMAPQTNVAQNTGMNQAVQMDATRAPQPQMMADGGVVKMQVGGMTGGTATAIAMLRENYPDIYEQVKDNPSDLAYAASQLAESARTPELTGLEELEAPREYDLLQRMFTDPSNRAVTQKQGEIAATQAERELAGQIATQQALRDRAGDAGLFAEGSITEMLKGTPKGGFPRRSEAMDVAPSLVSPNIEDFIAPTAPAKDMGIRSLSGFGEVPQAPAMEGFTAPETDFSYAPGSPAETAAIRRYLAGKDQGLGIPEEVERRASEFYGSDTYTPPEQIYDLGPKGGIKYITEDPTERDRMFAETSQREFLERQADAEAADRRALELDAQRQAEQAAADRVGAKIASDQPEAPLGFLEELISSGAGKLGAFSRERADLAAARAADETAVDTMGGIVPFEQTELGRQQKAEEAAAQDIAEISGGTKTTSGSGTGAGGAFGSLDSRIATMLSERQKQAESDKWMALAYAGMEMMKPTATVGEGLGKAGQAGLAYLTQAKKGMQDFETDMLKLQSQLDIARTRAAGGSKSGALTLNQYLSRGEDLITAGQKMLENAGTNADAAARGQDLIDRGMALISIATGGGSASSGGAKTVNIS